jgi:deazaflavin-dependent oxidoreductase (nitroreductase family)
MGRWFGSPVLILEVVGRRSGKRRRTPMTYCLLEGTYVVVAINGGSSRVPAWWLNLRTSGEGTIAVRGARHQVAARESAGPERERLWRAYAKQAPALEDFRSFAGREIPVVVLEPIEPVPANER